jgi:quercetin dioxygenase-like cupin family protein
MSEKLIVRKLLLDANIGAREIDHVEIREISFEPGQKTGRHLHPCPVVGNIVEGEVIFKIEGQSEIILRKGDAFFEPAGMLIERFDNASTEKGMIFVANYLLKGLQELIQMLP